MQCPKCGTKMRTICTTSQVSQLAKAINTGKWNKGHTCWNCGKWIDVEIEPVKPMPGLQNRTDSSKYHNYARINGAGTFKLFVQDNYEAIKYMRDSGLFWVDIGEQFGCSSTRLCKEYREIENEQANTD